MRKSDRKYLRVGKAAEELGLHPITIGRWMKMGKIQAVRVGSEARMSGHDQRPDLDRQIERQTAWAKAERPGREVVITSSDRLTNRHGKFRLCFMGRDESAVPCLGQGWMGFHFSTAVRE